MKRTVRYLLIMLFFILLSFHVGLSKADVRRNDNTSFRIEKKIIQQKDWKETKEDQQTLPYGLVSIGEEAFEGTALTNIVIHENVKEIGDRAFIHNGDLVISGFDESFVQKWAYYKKIRFIILERIQRAKDTRNIGCIPERKEKKISRIQVRSAYFCLWWNTKHIRKSSRSIGELKASCYTGSASIYVRSRYFP